MRSEEEKETEILRGMEREEKVRERKGKGREGEREGGKGGSGNALTNQANIHLITAANVACLPGPSLNNVNLTVFSFVCFALFWVLLLLLVFVCLWFLERLSLELC